MRERFSRRVEERTFRYRAERPTHREKNHQAARLECRGLWSMRCRQKEEREAENSIAATIKRRTP